MIPNNYTREILINLLADCEDQNTDSEAISYDDLMTEKLREICMEMGKIINPREKRYRILERLQVEDNEIESEDEKYDEENSSSQETFEEVFLNYLDLWSNNYLEQYQLKDKICQYIYHKLLESDDFSDLRRVRKTFFLTYGEILKKHFQIMKYPGINSCLLHSDISRSKYTQWPTNKLFTDLGEERDMGQSEVFSYKTKHWENKTGESKYTSRIFISFRTSHHPQVNRRLP
jgi:hypothetical protein